MPKSVSLKMFKTLLAKCSFLKQRMSHFGQVVEYLCCSEMNISLINAVCNQIWSTMLLCCSEDRIVFFF